LDVTFEVVPRLAIDPATGKFRRMVSLVGPPADLPQAQPAAPPAPPVCGVPCAFPQPA
jgi:hypothetical protein